MGARFLPATAIPARLYQAISPRLWPPLPRAGLGAAPQATTRVIVPLSPDQVAKFWSSFHTFRDLAVTGLMLLDGGPCGVLALQLEDLQLAHAQMRVLGKG